jgi:tagatose 1,6-diphosphate aldolase GatY/KbaY
MIKSTKELFQTAQSGSYALGAFNVYNLEGVKAVLAAAEAENSPVLLQVHPSALRYAGMPLIALCTEAARLAKIPVAIHLDHSTSEAEILAVMKFGVQSVMADGSRLSFPENIEFTRRICEEAHEIGVVVEAELGRLSGTEDGLTVPEYESLLTDPVQAVEFCAKTGIDALAVCIGNVHGNYIGEPRLDFVRLAEIRRLVNVPLVLHGASGLPEALIRQAIEIGVQKFNVNTELREAYVSALRVSLAREERIDLVQILESVVEGMKAIVVEKLRLLGSSGKANP